MKDSEQEVINGGNHGNPLTSKLQNDNLSDTNHNKPKGKRSFRKTNEISDSSSSLSSLSSSNSDSEVIETFNDGPSLIHDSQLNGDSHENKNSGSHDNKDSGSHANKDSGTHDNKESSSHDNKDSGSHDNKDSGSRGNENQSLSNEMEVIRKEKEKIEEMLASSNEKNKVIKVFIFYDG